MSDTILLETQQHGVLKRQRQRFSPCLAPLSASTTLLTTRPVTGDADDLPTIFSTRASTSGHVHSSSSSTAGGRGVFFLGGIRLPLMVRRVHRSSQCRRRCLTFVRGDQAIPPPPFKVYLHDSMGPERKGSLAIILQGVMAAAAASAGHAAAAATERAPQVECAAYGASGYVVVCRAALSKLAFVSFVPCRSVGGGIFGRRRAVRRRVAVPAAVRARM